MHRPVMRHSELDIIDHRGSEHRPPGLFGDPFSGASHGALPPVASMAPSRIEIMVDTLGFLDCGWAILDRHLRILHLNARIREFIGKGLIIVDRQLSSFRRADQERLTNYLRGILCGSISAIGTDHAFVHLSRRDQLPLIVRAHCVSRSLPDEKSGPLGIVLVTDPEHSPFPKQSPLQVALGLSNSEARIAVALINGASLVQAADHVGVSHETARSHLKSIFAKTGTNRQGELVVLLNRLSRLG
jgi:DNA-binding CsgD family transcriptional regulator